MTPSLRWKKSLPLLIILGLLLPISFQCIKTPLEPVAPIWTTQLTIPLVDRTFTFEDMVKKDKKFYTDSGGQILYQPSSLSNKPTGITLPTLKPLSANIGNKLGLVPLDVPAVPAFEGTFKTFFGQDPPIVINPITGDTLGYPGNDTTISYSSLVSGDSPLYDWVVFETGRISLTVTNGFQFSLRFPSGIQIVNDSDNTVVATLTFAGDISPNTTQTSEPSVPPENLSGKRMDARLRMSFTLQTVGINGAQIRSTDRVSAATTIDGGTAGSKATLSSAKVALTSSYPVYNKPDSAIQLVDDSTSLNRAEFSGGGFLIRIVNAIATGIVVRFEFYEFRDKATDQSFKLKDPQTGIRDTVVTVPASATLGDPIDLRDYVLQAVKKDPNGEYVTDTVFSTKTARFTISIRTLAATTGKVVISKDDSVNVAVIPDKDAQGQIIPYTIKQVTGKVKPTPVAIRDTVSAGIGDVSTNFTADSIKFDSVTITLNVLSTGLFPTDLTMKVVALDKNGVRGDSLIARELLTNSDTLRILPGDTKKIVFTKTNSTIDRFLSSFFVGGQGRLPDKLAIEGRALIDPLDVYSDPVQKGIVRNTDSVYTSVDFVFPVRIGIMNGAYRDTIEIADTSGGEKVDKKTLSNIVNGKVIFSIDNSFPLNLEVKTALVKADSLNPTRPDTTNILLYLPKSDSVSRVLGIDTIRVDSARYFTGNQLGKSYTEIDLVPDDVDKFNPARFMFLNVKLRTSGNSSPVVFNRSNYIRLKAFASVLFNVDFSSTK